MILRIVATALIGTLPIATFAAGGGLKPLDAKSSLDDRGSLQRGAVDVRGAVEKRQPLSKARCANPRAPMGQPGGCAHCARHHGSHRVRHPQPRNPLPHEALNAQRPPALTDGPYLHRTAL